MPEGVVQRRGVPQSAVVAERFGQQSLGAPVLLFDGILPTAKTPRVDLPAMGALNVAAEAAKRSMIQLFNPAGSNTSLLLKRLWVSSGADSAIELKIHDAALASVATTTGSMVRQEGTSQDSPIARIRHDKAASVGSAIGSFEALTDVLLLLNFQTGDGDHFDGFVIEPGRGILVAPNADNISIRTTWQWLERQTA